MTFTERLRETIAACFTAIWIESHEHADSLAEIQTLCRAQDPAWRLATWDIESGLRLSGDPAAEGGTCHDPLAAIRALSSFASDEGTTILVLTNFHRFLASTEIVQALARQILLGKQHRTIVIVLSPVIQIPIELARLFLTVEWELPSRTQLLSIAQGVATEAGELPTGTDLERVLDAAAGLTRYEAENAFSLSLVRHGTLQADPLWELKSQQLLKEGLVRLYRGTEDFGSLGGLDALKAFCRRALLPSTRERPRVRPRGILLLGVPGTGKSAFAKALGRETARPTVVLDIGALMGSLVGQTEANIRRALQIADSMQPCILFVDEIDKALSGVQGTGDSGVSARLFGTLLSYLSDKETDVFVVASANRIDHLPAEFTRAERLDGVFFLDLPGAPERQAIWQQYLLQFELDLSQRLPPDEGWTGAEIRSCCRLAALLDLPLVQAAQHVVPVSVTAAESIDALRRWATGRCLSASSPGIYRQGESSTGPRRRVARGGPSPN